MAKKWYEMVSPNTNAFCATGPGGGKDNSCGSGGSGASGKESHPPQKVGPRQERKNKQAKAKAFVSVGTWVKTPNGNRGSISHVYEDNVNEKGRLVEVDMGAMASHLGGGIKKVNFRETVLKKHSDQNSGFADFPG